MAGKAPLLLAMVLFVVGAFGLGLTSVERASFGSFQPRSNPLTKTEVLVFDAGVLPATPPSLNELITPPLATESAMTLVADPVENYVAVPRATEAPGEPAPEATPTPLPPLRVFGISSDDGGVSAAAATPATPPPIRIGGISFDEEPSTETPTPTPEPEATPTPE
jgi:hypothetical protein